LKEYDQIFDWYLASRDHNTGVTSVELAFKSLATDSAIVDLGCGTGLPLVKRIEQMGKNVIGVDSSMSMIESFKTNFPNQEAIHSRLQDYVFPKTRVNGVLCWGCLFHLTPKDQIDVLNNIFNSVVCGGKFLFTSAKQKGSTTGEMNGISFKYYSLGSAEYNELANDAGWKLIHESEDAGKNYEYLFKKL
jgi:cyclopropane fatty-acyl-phospholipid synthase-like methyltransferase